VHVRVASPPLRYSCFMGINIPTRDELIANKLDLEQLAQYIGMEFYCRAGSSHKKFSWLVGQSRLQPVIQTSLVYIFVVRHLFAVSGMSATS